MSQRRDDARALAAAAAAARAPRSCRACGRLFIGQAFAIHFEAGEGTRCLPGDAYGQLVELDGGAWALAGTGR